jgi:hypothetical protein
MTLQIIIGILIVHFIADFYYQTHEMAVNKSKSIKWLSYHILVYTLILFLGGFLYWNEQHIAVVYFTLINGTAHWIIDFFTSKATKYLWKAKQLHNFYVVLGLDQLIHYLILFISYTLLFN